MSDRAVSIGSRADSRMLTVEVSLRAAEPRVTIYEATSQRISADGLVFAAVTSPAPTDFDDLRVWLSRGCPDSSAPRQAFGVVSVEPRTGRVLAATSARTEVCLFYAQTATSLVVSSHLAGLVARLPELPELNVAKLADLMTLSDDSRSTVFAGVSRVPTGHRMRWQPGQTPTVSRWFHPDAVVRFRALKPGDDAVLMRDAVRGAVTASVPESGDVAAALSGGLDSTMVVATAAGILVPQGRKVNAATHVPLPRAAAIKSGWEPDDGPYARLMAERTPGLTYTPLVNTAKKTPLDVLPWIFETTFAPVLVHSSVVWGAAMTEWARSLGSQVLLGGDMGNASFSRNRAGIRRQLVLAGRWGPVLRDLPLQRRSGQSWAPIMFSLAGAIAPDWVHRLRGRLPANSSVRFAQEMPLRPEMISDEASQLLKASALGSQARAHSAWVDFVMEDPSLSPSAPDIDLWFSDPLSDPEVIRTAFSLPLESWIGGGLDRSVARRAMVGLVPDEIRLRTTRGEQSADFGEWIQGREQQYQEAMDEVSASPSAQRFIDVAKLRASLAAGLPHPGRAAYDWDLTHGRALNLGLFAAWWDHKVRATPGP
ncbi:MAG: hypothetical protein KAZ48_08325 [Candidatus Nanopelagicales bacterium]|nr:hypothetical protein [Candidatus Nanopelagicales bacterium]